MPFPDESREARSFFEAGCRGLSWTVFERISCVHSAEEFDAVIRAALASGDHVAFGLWRHQVIHAPLFGVVAPPDLQDEIVATIAAFPAERRAQYEFWERRQYQRLGWPLKIIGAMRPSDRLPSADDFGHPGLLMARDPAGTLRLLGPFIEPSLFLTDVLHPEYSTDTANLVMLLATMHCDPSLPDSPLMVSRPFHPRRFSQLRAAFLDRKGRLDQVLAALLLKHLPSVLVGLSERPPRRGGSLRQALRSRLVEAVSHDLSPERRRRGHRRWRDLREVDELDLQRVRLSPTERRLVQDLRSEPQLTPAAWARRNGKKPSVADTMLTRVRKKLRRSS